MNEGLDEQRIERDPIKQFQLWFDDAIAAKLPMPDATSPAASQTTPKEVTKGQ